MASSLSTSAYSSVIDQEDNNPLLKLTLSCNTSQPFATYYFFNNSPSTGSAIDQEDDNPILKFTLYYNPPSSKRNRTHNPECATSHNPPPKKAKSLKNNVLLGRQESWITKTLEKSDVNNLARLMVCKREAEEVLLAYWDEGMRERLKDKEGVAVEVWDSDCDVVFDMKMKIWGRNGSVVVNGGWITKFVKRRGLIKGDKIGLYWDTSRSRLVFSVLRRVVINATPIRYCLPSTQ